MKIGALKKLQSYLFLKILLVFTLAIFSVITFIIVSHRLLFIPPMFPAIQKNAVNYARYVIDKLGTPPDISRAQALAKKLEIRIRFKSQELSWASREDMIDFPDLKLPAYEKEKGVFAGFSRAGFCVDIRQDKNRYLLVIHPRREGPFFAAELFAFSVLAFTILLIMVMYVIMNRLLKPIKVLREGVTQLSEGNIDYEMHTDRTDELGKLVDSFNTMTRRIREMIQARDQLLRDVSHELRSPLTRVNVALEFLEDNDTKKNIRDDISEMGAMITELLETDRLKSQHGALELEKTNMLQLIREVCDELHGQKPGIKIVSFPGDITLEIDQKRIKTLFRNILNNALRYSTPESYPVEISLREKPGEFIIAVQDFGSGIPEQDLPYIFEPFYRVDKSRSKETGGYGLGMSLAKRIMAAHGGDIEITSRLKVGTTIFLKFKR